MKFNSIKQIIENNKSILSLLAIFLALYPFNLTKYPLVWCDEAFFANPAFNLAFHGFFGTTMMPLFYNIASYTYWQMPFYIVLLSISFRLFGFGVLQGRIVSVGLAFFTVIFTYLLGKELYYKDIGLLAALLLIFNPLFFFVSRTIRMDIAVACFTLVALYFIVRALKTGKSYYYFITGLFSALSVLSHPNGILGVVSVILIYFMCKIDFKNHKIKFKLKEILYMIISPILLLIPYLWYISLDFPDFIRQFGSNMGSSTGNHLMIIFMESSRYQNLNIFINSELGILSVLLLFILMFLVVLIIIYLFKSKNSFNSKFLIINLIVPIVVFALIDQKMSYWYFTIILPYWSLIIAIIFNNKIEFKKGIRIFISILILSLLFLNCIWITNALYESKNIENNAIEYEVQKFVPNGSVVSGDPTLWLSLHENYIYYDEYMLDPSYYKRLHTPPENLSFLGFKSAGVQYFLYDAGCEINSNSFTNAEFLKNNCTLIGEIPYNPNIGFRIKIYKII